LPIFAPPDLPLKGVHGQEKNFVQNQKEIQEKYNIKKEVGFDFSEQDKIFVDQKDDQADDRDQVLHQKRDLRKPVKKFYHQGIQFFSPQMDNFQREIGIEHAQDHDGKDQCQIFGIVAVDIIIVVFFHTTGMSPVSLEYVSAEGTGRGFPPVRSFSSICLHVFLLSDQMWFSPILYIKQKESIILEDELGGDISAKSGMW
jgi:hypothetical protein